MLLETLTRPELREPVIRSLHARGNGRSNSVAGEDRLVVSGLDWEGYLKLDRAFGQDRSGPRFYYLDGELEIMTTSLLHEKLKECWVSLSKTSCSKPVAKRSQGARQPCAY
jgi:hypothetical protein